MCPLGKYIQCWFSKSRTESYINTSFVASAGTSLAVQMGNVHLASICLVVLYLGWYFPPNKESLVLYLLYWDLLSRLALWWYFAILYLFSQHCTLCVDKFRI